MFFDIVQIHSINLTHVIICLSILLCLLGLHPAKYFKQAKSCCNSIFSLHNVTISCSKLMFCNKAFWLECWQLLAKSNQPGSYLHTPHQHKLLNKLMCYLLMLHHLQPIWICCLDVDFNVEPCMSDLSRVLHDHKYALKELRTICSELKVSSQIFYFANSPLKCGRQKILIPCRPNYSLFCKSL
jgi:hypothetical protein